MNRNNKLIINDYWNRCCGNTDKIFNYNNINNYLGLYTQQ